MEKRYIGTDDPDVIAKGLRSKAPKGATHVLIGPALIYGDDEKIGVCTFAGRPGKPAVGQMVLFGKFEPELDRDSPLYQVADTVMWLRRAGSYTKGEADELRARIVEAAGKRFKVVRGCDTDLDVAEAQAELFPSDRARSVLAGVRAEEAAKAAE